MVKVTECSATHIGYCCLSLPARGHTALSESSVNSFWFIPCILDYWTLCWKCYQAWYPCCCVIMRWNVLWRLGFCFQGHRVLTIKKYQNTQISTIYPSELWGLFCPKLGMLIRLCDVLRVWSQGHTHRVWILKRMLSSYLPFWTAEPFAITFDVMLHL